MCLSGKWLGQGLDLRDHMCGSLDICCDGGNELSPPRTRWNVAAAFSRASLLPPILLCPVLTNGHSWGLLFELAVLFMDSTMVRGCPEKVSLTSSPCPLSSPRCGSRLLLNPSQVPRSLRGPFSEALNLQSKLQWEHFPRAAGYDRCYFMEHGTRDVKYIVHKRQEEGSNILDWGRLLFFFLSFFLVNASFQVNSNPSRAIIYIILGSSMIWGRWLLLWLGETLGGYKLSKGNFTHCHMGLWSSLLQEGQELTFHAVLCQWGPCT